ncbi:ATPase family AAA domain-containing protein 3-A [Thelohanellus kitauei]|uniref:ATPase family AAA domain-containing protein 3-A n=1 Tax=Thelohanellus kitauei TaxID=669202 RepID=A0A0C2N1L4_THEKT|nr:ATPase family AAA domain-containing protein 3-A [Thelohanellus kitauei]
MNFNIFKGMGSSDPSDSNNGNRQGKGRAIYDFDPSGLERAARSAKDLKDNPNAPQILDLAIIDAQNKRLEIMKDQKAYELKIEQAKIDAVKQQHEYAVEILKEEAKTHRTKAEYEDFLARKRQEDRIELEKKSQFDFLKIQEDSVKRQEEIRKKTIDYEFQKKAEVEREMSELYWKNKTKFREEFGELHMKKYNLKLQNDFEKSKFYVKSVRDMFVDGFTTLYENKIKFLTITAGICTLTGAFVLTRHGLQLGIRLFEAHVTTPKLFKETKKTASYFGRFNRPTFVPLHNLESSGLIYNKSTESLLLDVVRSTQTSLTNKSMLRNFLFYGPPGTGKTLFARQLAHNCGLNYAIMTGGDVLPLRDKAVTQLNKIFDYSDRQKGFLLFLDEADAFLKKRDYFEIGEEMRSALNTFLFRTGESSSRMMLILATNKPEQLDSAVTDRIDMMVEFPLPDGHSRKRLFDYYMKLFLKDVKMDENLAEEMLDELAEMSEGFSAREITKLCASWRLSAGSHPENRLSKEVIIMGIREMSKQHSTKHTWQEQTIALSHLKKH